MQKKKIAVDLSAMVPHATTAEPIRVEYQLLSPATVEYLKVKFNAGPAGDVRVVPVLERSNGHRESLVHFAGAKKYIDGDNVLLEYDVNIGAERLDKLVVEYWNYDIANDYNVITAIEVDFQEGSDRWKGAR